jgi:endonuclease-3
LAAKKSVRSVGKSVGRSIGKSFGKSVGTGLSPVLGRLAAAIPEPRCELDHRDAWTLLMATILSAQSTDRTVNSVTPALFASWPTPRALAGAPRGEVEQAVHRTGFFRNKAKAIQECSRELCERHGGEVPRTLAALVELPGVARKTANVVLGVAWRIAEGVVVDTHVTRVARRLGFTEEDKPEAIERDLMAALPRAQWIDGGHRLLLHGRYLCTAREPQCAQCPLNELCPSRAAPAQGSWEMRASRERDLVGTSGGAA